MPRLDRLPQISRNNLLTFPAQVNDTTPFRLPAKPITACRLAIVTTAGVHVRGDRLFTPGDQLRELVARGELGGLGPSHYSFMGAQREVARIESQTGPEVARRLVEEGVDLALITPT